MPEIKLKSLAEVKAKLREVLHARATRWVKQHNVPCPENCCHAPKLGGRVQTCTMCGAKPGEPCKLDSQFKARYTFGELKLMYKERLENREWVLRDDPGVKWLLWVLGQLDPSEEPDPKPLPDHLLQDPSGTDPPIWCKLEGNTLTLSPTAVPVIQALLAQLPALFKDLPNGKTLDRRALGEESRGADRVAGAGLPAGDQGGQGPDSGPDGT